jgi:hypothetical protein
VIRSLQKVAHKTMNNFLAGLTEADIRARCTTESFSRGQSYYAYGAIKKRLRQPALLEAWVEGTKLYRVSLWVKADGQLEPHCTCPYQFGGDCKHIVAVLLAWLKEPESFQPPVDLKAVLKGRSYEELVSLLLDVFSIYPHLVDDLAVVSGAISLDNPEAVANVFEAMVPYGYLTADQGAAWLMIIARRADQLAEQGQLETARRVYYEMVTGALRLSNDHYAHGDGFFTSAIEADLAAGYAEIAVLQLEQHRAVIEAEVRNIGQGEFTWEILNGALMELEDALAGRSEVDDPD